MRTNGIVDVLARCRAVALLARLNLVVADIARA